MHIHCSTQMLILNAPSAAKIGSSTLIYKMKIMLFVSFWIYQNVALLNIYLELVCWMKRASFK